jgi:hypothetical protein
VVKTVGFQEHVFSGKAQVGPAQNSFRSRSFSGYRRGKYSAGRTSTSRLRRYLQKRKQRDTALGGNHSGDGVIRTGQLHGVAEIETFVFQRAQLRRQVREGIVIKVRAFQASP